MQVKKAWLILGRQQTTDSGYSSSLWEKKLFALVGPAYSILIIYCIIIVNDGRNGMYTIQFIEIKRVSGISSMFLLYTLQRTRSMCIIYIMQMCLGKL